MAREINILPPEIGDYRESPAQQGRIQGGTRVIGDLCTASVPSHPLVSIITIVLNGEKNIEKTIKSVLDQTYDNIEYFIIDGGSTDGTLDMIRKHEDKISCWISESDNGISDAFNKGIAAATGEIVGIINADDWYEEDAVACAVEAMRNTDADIVYGMLRTWDGETPFELMAADHRLLDREMSLSHPSVFATRASYEKIGLYRIAFRYAMDYEWLLRAKKAGLKFSSVGKCLANMRLDGISNINWREPLKEEVRARNLVNPSIMNSIFCRYKIIKGFIRRFFEKIGLHNIVRLFHAHISSVKKTGARD